MVQQHPDIALVPATIYAIVPTYNLPELDGLELVLDFDTIAAIYMAEITQWNDARIKAINSPAVANALPAKSIVVVTQTTSSAITQLFTTMLSAKVAAFAAQVPSPFAGTLSYSGLRSPSLCQRCAGGRERRGYISGAIRCQPVDRHG
jgi:ABC-type phosphate transport system substrate-binding protein